MRTGCVPTRHSARCPWVTALGAAFCLAVVPLPVSAASSMVLQSFDGPTVPVNLAGDPYPSWSDGRGGEGGVFAGTINAVDAASGSSFEAHLVATPGTGNTFYAQFNPYDVATRGFARDYSADPAGWQFNTYTRMSFWIKPPVDPARGLQTDGTSNANVGTYVKTVANSDPYSDESGGGHFYHNLNLPRVGTWVHVVLNMHPDHERGASGGTEQPNLPHPTGEPAYDYYDAFTRFYIQDNDGPPSLPADYLLDEFVFYQEPNDENDDQIRNISATYVPADNRVIVTWFRDKDENDVDHEVRYAFADIHQGGWSGATPASDGIRTPPGWQGYNGMFYDSTALPLAGHDTLFLAIKPNNSSRFTQVIVPLTGPLVNTPPTITIPAVATPNPVLAGDSVSLVVQADDADGDTLAYSWSLGDGIVASGAAVAHAYPASGVFVNTVTVADGRGGTATSAVAVAVDPPLDAAPLGVARLRGRVRFDTAGRDAAAIAATLPGSAVPAVLAGATVWVDVAGVPVAFTLDARGTGRAAAGRCRLHRNARGAGTLKVKLRGGSWAAFWADDGMVNADRVRVPLTLRVAATVNGSAFVGTKGVAYTARAGKRGAFH